MATESPPRRFEIVPIEEEMQRSYLDYAMSVIVSRALPDVRDGLKPVHRRILYTMHEGGYTSGKAPPKSARIVGDVMGKYHPHGNDAIYDALVRMAQDFSMRLPLIDGQGNFGSMDGDAPAAMRYTEARLAQAADALLADIDKDTVDFRPNYDETTREPTVLPAQFPNLLVNGAGGIAVGMATNIPPHNLGEVIDACIALVDDPELELGAPARAGAGAGFPDRRHHPRPVRHPPGLPHRARQPAAALAHPHRGDPEGPRRDHRDRDPLSRSTRRACSSASANWCASAGSRASPTCATRAIATALAW